MTLVQVFAMGSELFLLPQPSCMVASDWPLPPPSCYALHFPLFPDFPAWKHRTTVVSKSQGMENTWQKGKAHCNHVSADTQSINCFRKKRSNLCVLPISVCEQPFTVLSIKRSWSLVAVENTHFFPLSLFSHPEYCPTDPWQSGRTEPNLPEDHHYLAKSNSEQDL